MSDLFIPWARAIWRNNPGGPESLLMRVEGGIYPWTSETLDEPREECLSWDPAQTTPRVFVPC